MLDLINKYLVYFFCIATILIAFAPCFDMPKGFALFCHKIRYLSLIAGAGAILYQLDATTLVALCLSFALFMGVWNRVVYWFKNINEFGLNP